MGDASIIISEISKPAKRSKLIKLQNLKEAKFAGIFILSGAHDNEFTYNTIKNTKWLTLWPGQSYEETQADGVFIDDNAGTGNVFNYNNIKKNAGDGMESQITTTIDAESNYWGKGDPTDYINGDIDYDPWLSKKYKTPK